LKLTDLAAKLRTQIGGKPSLNAGSLAAHTSISALRAMPVLQRQSAEFVIASGFWCWLLNRLGCAAITMPWKTIYILDEHKFNQSLRRHELVHIEQIERDGAVMFSIKYLWWLARYGYWANPYEVDAYAKEPISEEN
jgi:hypothetical protein